MPRNVVKLKEDINMKNIASAMIAFLEITKERNLCLENVYISLYILQYFDSSTTDIKT